MSNFRLDHLLKSAEILTNKRTQNAEIVKNQSAVHSMVKDIKVV